MNVAVVSGQTDKSGVLGKSKKKFVKNLLNKENLHF